MQVRKSGIMSVVTLCLASAVVFCGCQEKRQRYEGQFLSLFDTATTVVSYYPTDSKAQFTADMEEFRQRLERYHQLYDIYNAYPDIVNLHTVNEKAGEEPVEVSEEIMSLLLFCREMYDVTEGRVNVAMGAVTDLWQQARMTALERPRDAYVPRQQDLEAAAEHTDMADLILDQQANTVYFADPQLRLDVGAVAKGFAVQRVMEEMEAEGFSDVLVSVGGNVHARGTKGGKGEKWNVGVQNPDLFAAEENLHILWLSDVSFVTSGSYQRYFTVDGKMYHHIIHPDTLRPGDRYQAVCVVTADSGVADALSTALFNSTLEQGQQILKTFPGTEVLWINADGSQNATAGFWGLTSP